MRKYRSRRLLVTTATVAAMLTASSPLDAAAEMIFDFEDGTLQGWEASPNISITPTNGVFGPGDAFAIFGTDGSSIRMDIDLTNVDQLILDVFTPSSAALESLALYITVRPGNTPPFDALGTLDLVDGDENPGQLVMSLAHLTGVHEVQIAWNGLSFLQDGDPTFPSPRAPTIYFPAYIDKITFKTSAEVPEPAGVALMAVGALALTIWRRVRLLG
jgi:hypothetical protein